ncbi:creatininase family protein [Ktedonosporobacter rubrisoli]|nr:creatininase family protein [Ktedonosporobacter rubrisoli]
MPEWAKLYWTDVAQAVETSRIALLPLGAIEEHGPHMNLGSDWYAVESLTARLAEAANLLVLPALPYGQVWSLSRFPGSLSISDQTLVNIIVEIAAGLAQVGIKGLILMSGHLGNMSALKTAARRLLESYDLPTLFLFYPGLEKICKQVSETERSRATIIHADEIETSILLALAPECVDMSRAQREYPHYPEDFDYSPLYWDEVSVSGVFGDPTAANQEKGKIIVEYVLQQTLRIIQAWRERGGF